MYLDFNTLRCGRSSLVLSVCLNVDVDALCLKLGSGHNDSPGLPVSKVATIKVPTDVANSSINVP